MYFNLDTLPTGVSLYTLYVTNDPKGTTRDDMSADEIDVTCKWGQAPKTESTVHPSGEPITEYLAEVYPESRIVGVVNQSDGYVVYDAFAAGDEA